MEQKRIWNSYNEHPLVKGIENGCSEAEFATAAPSVAELPTGPLVVSCRTNECMPDPDTFVMVLAVSDGTPAPLLTAASFALHEYPFRCDHGADAQMRNGLYANDRYLYASCGSREQGILVRRYEID